jgi:hypothetical protein
LNRLRAAYPLKFHAACKWRLDAPKVAAAAFFDPDECAQSHIGAWRALLPSARLLARRCSRLPAVSWIVGPKSGYTVSGQER